MSTMPREDATRQPDGRYVVYTTDETVWVATWAEFKAAKGVMCWSEDQTEITLELPVGHKFSIKFTRKVNQ